MQSVSTLLLITCFTTGFQDVQGSSLTALGIIRTTGSGAISKERAFPTELRTISGRSVTLPQAIDSSIKIEFKPNDFMKEDALLADLDAILQRELSTNEPPLKFGEIVYL